MLTELLLINYIIIMTEHWHMIDSVVHDVYTLLLTCENLILCA